MKLMFKVYAMTILAFVGGLIGLSIFMGEFFGSNQSMTTIIESFLGGLV